MSIGLSPLRVGAHPFRARLYKLRTLGLLLFASGRLRRSPPHRGLLPFGKLLFIDYLTGPEVPSAIASSSTFWRQFFP
jgi:hypothetical protein